jgi:hypothetical protein
MMLGERGGRRGAVPSVDQCLILWPLSSDEVPELGPAMALGRAPCCCTTRGRAPVRFLSESHLGAALLK